jgi:protein-tyrosine phosphatase
MSDMERQQRKPSWARRLARAARYPSVRQYLWHEWRRRRGGPVDLPPGEVRRILVICHGNICRSPFAERWLARARPDLEVRSAGLAAREGKPAEPGARRIATRFGLDLATHAAHRMEAADVDWADLILGMQGHHKTAVARRWPDSGARNQLLGDFLAAPPHAIEDPWGLPDDVFQQTFEKIVAALVELERRLPKPGADA